MTYEQLLELCRLYEGATLHTITGKGFRVGIYVETPFFRPESSGLGQSDGRKAVEAFVERFNRTHSLRPKDYADVSRNASYLIGVVLRAREDGRLPALSTLAVSP